MTATTAGEWVSNLGGVKYVSATEERENMTEYLTNLSWQVEEACINLRPAPFETVMRGWLIRTGGGCVRRINAACPTQFRSSHFEPIFDAAEDIYRTLARPSIIKVLSIADDVDGLLHGRGYMSEGHSKVLIGDYPSVLPDTSAVQVREGTVDQEWLEAWATIGKTQSVEARTVFEGSMKAIVLPKAFAALKVNGEITSTAYGVLHQGLLGIDAVATRADGRGNGYAHRVVSALQEWANRSDVRTSCLSVEADNKAALALYSKCGLNRHLYDYHYRVKRFELP